MSALAGLVADHSAWIGAGAMLALLLAFAAERAPPVNIALAGAVAMLLLGYLSPGELLGVFANPAPIAIAAMFILSAALTRTGAIESIVALTLARATRHPRRALAEIGVGATFASGVMNNTPVVLVLIPIAKRLAGALRMAPTKLLIPLSYISILGGTLTLIGTSTNLLVAGVAREAGLAPFGVFDITPVGLVTAGAGIAFLLLTARWLLPARGGGDEADAVPAYLADLRVLGTSPHIGRAFSDTPLARRPGLSLLGIRRGGTLWRDGAAQRRLEAGDVLVVRATPEELISLGAAPGLLVGLSLRERGIALAGATAPRDLQFVEVGVSPTHPMIGRRLIEIPFLSRLRVRVLGLARSRHVAGPDLMNVRIRAGDRLLVAGGPDAVHGLRRNVNLVDVAHARAKAFRRDKAWVAVATLVGVVLSAALLGWPIEVAAIVGVAIVLVTGCLDPADAWESLDGNVLVLIFAMLAFGRGLQNAGTVELMVGAMTPWLATAAPVVLLVGVYALTSILTELITNNAVAVIMTPLAIALATSLGVDPRPLVVAVMFAASASFATPIGYQTNTLVYGAAPYRFADFLKVGVPMNIVAGAAACGALALGL